MENKKILVNTRYPKVVTNLATQNNFLKIITYALLGLLTLMFLLVIYFMSRGHRLLHLKLQVNLQF